MGAWGEVFEVFIIEGVVIFQGPSSLCLNALLHAFECSISMYTVGYIVFLCCVTDCNFTQF